jgi:uncharacterized membrane protein YraQ (UPF0718 family)
MIAYIITIICLVVSFYYNKKKSVKALKIAWKKFSNILPAFLVMLVFVSIALGVIPEDIYTTFLSKGNPIVSFISGLSLGSIAMMPGFIAFPLSGILLSKGVSYTTLSVFTSSLMLVGVLTFPVEKKYLGFNVAFARNIISVITAIVIALVTGLCYGELL